MFTKTKRWQKHKCPFTDKWIKLNVINTYNRILFSLRKEEKSDINHNTDKDLEDIILISQSQNDK